MARALGWLALVAPMLAIAWLLVPRGEHVPLLPVAVTIAFSWSLGAIGLRGGFDRAPRWVFFALVAIAPLLVFPFVVYSESSGFALLFVWATPYAFCWFGLPVAAAETAFAVGCYLTARLLSPYGHDGVGETIIDAAMVAATIVALGLFARALTNAARRQEGIRTHRERVIAEFGRASLDGIDSQKLIDRALRIATTELQADAAVVSRLDAADNMLRLDSVTTATGVSTWNLDTVIPGDGGSLLARGMRDGLVITDDLLNDQRVTPIVGLNDADLHAGIAVAIRGRHGDTLGALGVYSRERARFSPDDAGFLQALANMVAAVKDHLVTEAELRHRALHDPLTGLPNRTLLADRLQRALVTCPAGESVAVLLIDLDRFKHVNDSLGHPVGDQLLVELAGRLRASVRAGDTLARMGGDEFVVVAERVLGTDHAQEIADRLATAWATPLQLGDRQLHLQASVGIVVSRPGIAADELLACADAAMYRGKELGGDRAELYDDGLREQATHQLRVEQGLRSALDNEELVLHFQPIVDPDTLRCRSLEALARWQHPERGLVGPADFIPTAEASGLIIPLGAHVLELALAQLAAWRRADGAFATVTVSVNVSTAQLSQPGFVACVRSLLDDHGLPPSALTLEITEGVLLRPDGPAVQSAQQLRALGVSLALDDFGTGYSSLSSLRSLPVSSLKIDRSFVAGLGDDDADTGVIRGILLMARGAQLSVVAEGVETAQQARLLVSMGCIAAQGFHYARPLDAEAAAAFVRRADLLGRRPTDGLRAA